MFPFELSFEIVEALLEKKPVKQTETAKPVKKEVKEIKKEVSEDKFTEASISPFLMPKYVFYLLAFLRFNVQKFNL